MLFKELIEEALSNDMIGIVNGDLLRDPADIIMPAYKFFDPKYEDLMQKSIDRFTLISKEYTRTKKPVLYVKIK